MSPAEEAAAFGSAFADGIDCLVRLRSLRESPAIVNAEDLETWNAALNGLQETLETAKSGHTGARQIVTSYRVSDALIHSVHNLRTALSSVAPDAPFPTSVLDYADAAYTELANSLP